ncbi:unnamed protein product [Allacma fusca]|uniref:DUF1736 domain-containing protein n=1 Tax=Allacma fusca TaxID=39272 RepID=A0A8J2JH19_9HEXA|nr:unnamed protein product [Allacma fusca]
MCLEVARTSKTSALFAGLHFATHPIHTEAVTGVVGRADLLAALFVLISFLCYDRYQKQVENKRLILTSILLAFGGMLSKEHGITVLGINLTWDVYLNRYLILNYFLTRKINAKMYNLFRRIFIIGLGGLAFVTFRIVMLQGSLPQFSDQDNPASFAPCKVTRFRTFVYLPAFNFWLLLAPISLNYDWQMGSIPLVDKWTDIRNIPCLVFYTTLSWTVVYLGFKSKTRRDVVVALSFLIIPFIPASNLLFRVGFVVAERVLYIPSLGFSLLVGAGAERIMMMQKSYMKINLTKICFMLILTLFTYKTWIRNEDWRSRESLFTSGLRLLPHNAKMHYNYANLQKDLGNTEQAISHYRIALQLWPHHASAHNNLGTLLNDTAAAESHFQKALKINPIHARAYFNLSLLRYQQGKTKIAIRLMERSLELEPDNPDALTNLAAMESDLGHFDRAKEIHLKILELEPNNADHLNNYAAFLQRIGLNSEALQMYEAALARDGNHTVALVNTARLMKKLKFNEKAESLYQRALERNPDDAVVKVNLAQTYVHQRKYNEAESLLLTVMEQSNSSRREVFHQLATLYSQHLNRTNDAFRYLKMAVETCLPFDITCAPLYALTGDLYKDIDDLDSAILSYKQAVETLNRANATECCPQQKYPLSSSIVTHVHLNLGAIYHVKGKYKDAWTHYNTAYAHDPKNKVLLQNMEKLRKAELRQKTSCHRQQENLTKSIA